MELVNSLCFKMLFMLVMFLAFRCGEGQVVIANTTLGQVMGLKINVGPGDPVLTRFAGIPYAEPPTGQLRFAKPVPKSPWDGVLNATAYGPKCSQAAGPNSSVEDRGMDEDCLTLNVYSPHTFVDVLGPLPVMVYIHGGALVNGEGAFYDGTSLALQGQVVVVNFNYRLGAFGFLSTGDDSAPGNYGLWDQRLAIQWVKDNIGNFGGDPDKITIFGESAGGWSVTYQMVSPVNNKTLFQRVIAQSGAAFPGIVNPRGFANMQAWSLGTSIGCDLPEGSSTQDLISCLRNVSADYLQNKMGNDYWNSKATIDGDFIPDDINSLLTHPRIGQYDLLLGIVSGEGSVFLHNNTQSFTAQDLEDNILSNISSTCYCKNPQEVTDAIQAWYFGADKLDNPRENVVKYTDVISDLYFDVASANLRNRHAAASTDTNTYFYYFTYETGKEFLLPPEFSGWFPGAPHGLDILYTFGWIGTYNPNDPWAAALSTNMIKYWAAFARSGDPNADGLSYWPKFEPENETYINLHPNVTIGRHFKADKIAFWVDYIPKITDLAFGAVSTPPPSTMTTPEVKPCKIGQSIGLSLTPEEASTLIEALIGVTIGVLVLAVFFFGGCMAYRSRINRLEAEAGKQGGGTKGKSNLNMETF